MTLLSWWGSFNLGETLVSPVAPTAKRSAWGSDVFSLCMGSEAVPCWCWKRRRCWQGRALRELCCGRSSRGGCWADHLCRIIWAQPAEMVSSAYFCMGSRVASIKWDCGCKKKCSLFLCPLTNSKLSVKPLTEPKKVTTLQPLTEPKKCPNCILRAWNNENTAVSPGKHATSLEMERHTCLLASHTRF